jgi:hypothetical protein
MSANKIKVSVSISPDMHEWLKAESKRETQESGEDVSVSRLVVRAVKAMQGKAASPERAGVKTLQASESSVTLRSTATKGSIRRAG